MSHSFRAGILAFVALSLFGARQASATCMTQCEVLLAYPDCTHPPDGTWPLGQTLTFTASCKTCCSPPGGPVTCEPSTVDLASFTVRQGAEAVPGAFKDTGLKCEAASLLSFDGTLAAGSTEIVSGATIVAQFTVVADVGCDADHGCGPCKACVAGKCKGLGLVACTKDADCGDGEVCKVDPVAPCNNACEAAPECVSDVDCDVCDACVSGKCELAPGVECWDDEDCGPGYLCQASEFDECDGSCVPGGECVTDSDCAECATCSGGYCEASIRECEVDEDCLIGTVCKVVDWCSSLCVPDDDCGGGCGPCEVCVNGECKDTGLVACTQDSDCGTGKTCKVDAAAPCKNACVDEPACTADSGCGPCEACVNGECKGTGLVACTQDSDCGAGKVCKVDATTPCKNACLPAPEGDEGTSPGDLPAGVEVTTGSDSTSPDASAPDAAAPGADAGQTPPEVSASSGGGCAAGGSSGRLSPVGLAGILALLTLLVGVRRLGGCRITRFRERSAPSECCDPAQLSLLGETRLGVTLRISS